MKIPITELLLLKMLLFVVLLYLSHLDREFLRLEKTSSVKLI